MLKDFIKREKQCFLIIYIAILLPSLLNSEEVVLHQFHSDEPDKSLEWVVYLAAGTALIDAGISSTQTNEKYNYILRTEYSINNSNLSIQFSLFSVPITKQPMATYGFNLHVDHEIDTQVAVAVRQILVRAGIESNSGRDAEIEGLFSKQRTAEAESTTPHVRRTDKASSSSTAKRGDRANSARTASDLSDSDEQREGVRLTTEFSPAGFLFFGAITEYFHYGFGSSLTVGLTQLSKRRSVFLGIDLGIVRVLNNKGVTGGPLYISISGVEAEYGTGRHVSYRFSAAVSGGAAFLSVAEGESAITKTVPYAKLSVFLGLPVGRRLYLGGAARFFTVFDPDGFLIAASPSIQMRMEF